MKTPNTPMNVPFNGWPTRRPRRRRARIVDDRLDDATQALPAPGEIVLLVGASGAGKTRLLRSTTRLAVRMGWSIRRPMPASQHRTVRESIDACDPATRDRMLSRFGLAEAALLDRRVRHISTGQRARLAIVRALVRAIGTSDARVLLVIDEFASQLDRVTAGVVAHALRRAIDDAGAGISVLLAGSQDDLVTFVPADRVLDVHAGRPRALPALDIAKSTDLSGVSEARGGAK